MEIGFNIYTILACIVILFILIWRMVSGFRHGLIRELSTMVSLATAVLVGALIYNGIMNFFEQKFGKTIAIIIFLAIVMSLFGLVKLIFKVLKLFASLPVISAVDKVLGSIIGIVEAFIIVVFLIKFIKAVIGI